MSMYTYMPVLVSACVCVKVYACKYVDVACTIKASYLFYPIWNGINAFKIDVRWQSSKDSTVNTFTYIASDSEIYPFFIGTKNTSA